MEDFIEEITVQADENGFLLLQCPNCHEYFKLKPQDYLTDDVIELWCPCCGLKAKSFFTDENTDIAFRKAKKQAGELIYYELTKREKMFKCQAITINVELVPPHEEEFPVKYGLESMEIHFYPCCNREIKIKPFYKQFGSYCPFCGVRYDDIK